MVRTLLILLAILPPVLALAGWCWKMAVAALVLALLGMFPELLVAGFVYAFGAICHLIGRFPDGK